MALTRLFVHDTYFDATDNFTYTPGMRLTLDNTTQSARITRLQASGVISTDETIDPAGVAITGGTINGTTIGATTPSTGAFTTLSVSAGTTSNVYNVEDANAVISRNSGALQFQTSGGNNIVMQASGDIIFNTDLGAEAMRWDSSTSRLGIGTSSPQSDLHISKSAPAFRITDTDTNATFQFNGQSTSGSILLQVDVGSVGSNPQLRFDIAGQTVGLFDDSGDVAFYDGAGSAQDFFWDASASRLGIGTTSPARALHVVGSVRITALPTSSAGLSAGDLWNDSGTVKVV